MNQSFASKLTEQLEQRKDLLNQYQQELENLQTEMQNSQSKVGSELKSYTKRVKNIIENSAARLQQLEAQINELTNITLPNWQELEQMLMSLQRLNDSKVEVDRIRQQIANYPREIEQQIQQAQQLVQQQLDQHQNQLSKQLENLKSNLKLRYMAVVTLVLFLILLCCTFYVSKTLYTRTQQLGHLNTIIGERQTELEKYQLAIQQAQVQLSRSHRSKR